MPSPIPAGRFGERAYGIPVGSQKSMLGHAIGASSVIEAGVSNIDAGLTPEERRAFMKTMRCTLRTLAAVLAGLALVAALPAPCGCAPQRTAPGHADEHACCAPRAGVSAADRTCCDESPAVADAAPSPAGPATVPALVAALRVEAALPLLVLARSAVAPAFSPPHAVLRI